MTVAVPDPQHSPTLGQLASSQTVLSDSSRKVRRTCSYRPPPGMRTLSHSGFGSRRVFPSWIKPAMKAAGITEAPADRENLGAGGLQHRAQQRQCDALRQSLGADRGPDAPEPL